MIHRSYRKLTALALIFAIGLSPMLTFAKGNDNNKGKVKSKERIELSVDKFEKKGKGKVEIEIESEDEDDDVKVKSKFKAFGHLIAPGFIKNWGWMDSDGFHSFPFGIWKKYIGYATTTPSSDITAPVISSIETRSNKSSVVVTWDTNERANSTIYWSTTSPVNTSSASTTSKNSLTRDHEIKLNNLSASTTYYAVVSSKDKAGNVGTSTQFTFSTKGSLTTDTQSPIISNVVALAGTSTLSVSWTTNEASNSRMFYSTTSPLLIGATTTNSVSQNSLVYNHSVQATNLATGTPYRIIIQSTDNAGNTSTSPEFIAITASGI